MTNLRANSLIYLGALLTLSTMVLPVVIDTQSSAPVRYPRSHLRREFPMPGFLADVHPAPVWTNAAWRKLFSDHNNC